LHVNVYVVVLVGLTTALPYVDLSAPVEKPVPVHSLVSVESQDNAEESPAF